MIHVHFLRSLLISFLFITEYVSEAREEVRLRIWQPFGEYLPSWMSRMEMGH